MAPGRGGGAGGSHRSDGHLDEHRAEHPESAFDTRVRRPDHVLQRRQDAAGQGRRDAGCLCVRRNCWEQRRCEGDSKERFHAGATCLALWQIAAGTFLQRLGPLGSSGWVDGRCESDRSLHGDRRQRGGRQPNDACPSRPGTENRRELSKVAAAHCRRYRSHSVSRGISVGRTATQEDDDHFDFRSHTFRKPNARRVGASAADSVRKAPFIARDQFGSTGVGDWGGASDVSVDVRPTTNSFATCDIPGSSRTNRSARIRSYSVATCPRSVAI